MKKLSFIAGLLLVCFVCTTVVFAGESGTARTERVSVPLMEGRGEPGSNRTQIAATQEGRGSERGRGGSDKKDSKSGTEDSGPK